MIEEAVIKYCNQKKSEYLNLVVSSLSIFTNHMIEWMFHDINGLVQDCSSPIANALELLQFCHKSSICCYENNYM